MQAVSKMIYLITYLFVGQDCNLLRNYTTFICALNDNHRILSPARGVQNLGDAYLFAGSASHNFIFNKVKVG